MATVLDPAGTISVVYNSSGKTLLASVQGGASIGPNFPFPTGSVATALPHYSEVMIVPVLFNSTGYAVALPASADIGDEVYIFPDPSSSGGSQNVTVFPPNGESINLLPASTGSNSGVNVGAGHFIKVSATNWQTF